MQRLVAISRENPVDAPEHLVTPVEREVVLTTERMVRAGGC